MADVGNHAHRRFREADQIGIGVLDNLPDTLAALGLGGGPFDIPR